LAATGSLPTASTNAARSRSAPLTSWNSSAPDAAYEGLEDNQGSSRGLAWSTPTFSGRAGPKTPGASHRGGRGREQRQEGARGALREGVAGAEVADPLEQLGAAAQPGVLIST
jgi:hypothetical protein